MGDETSKRLQASPGGFSEVTALSQRAINNAMAKLVKDHPEISHVQSKSKRGDALDAQIGQPLISLKVTGSSRASLEYYAKFSSGKLHFNYDPPEDFDVEGWTIAFNVQIDSVKLEPGSDEDKQVRGAIQQAGDFSLTSLFLTFNEGDIIKPDLDHSDFKGAKLDRDDIITFAGILAKWYVNDGPMTDRRKRTIGYGLRTANPESVNKQAPSFSPTSLKFQTYEYIAPGKKDPEEGIPEGDNNMLLYLQMTDKKDFPPEAILPYTGNFVSNGMGGTMCIEKGIFWDRYLLRKTTPQLLHLFNNSTYAWAKSADLTDIEHPDWEVGVGGSGHAGDPDFFAWVSSGLLQWTWGSPSQPEQQIRKRNSYGNESGSIDVTCTTNNSMKTKPGSNLIDVSGKSDIQVYVTCGATCSTSPCAPWACHYTVHVWLEWETAISLNAVDDGGLAISLDLNDSNFKVSWDPLKYSMVGSTYPTRESVEAKQSTLQNTLITELRNSPLRAVEAQLQKDLNNSARFVVPGQGTFHYKNPMFNDNGDLLIEVDYKE
ncbi:hypothetical protein BDW59DRAFT_164189 [Aspergillus cavernicola]|uniref:Peptide N-acetyl-beta-D-glucosaminyl asparaginase amidase A-domain-containing protein n=1 Tax=Aspergillus cavernicola TaxID=176166 RepID=A0ABR4I127_9EURO